MSKVIQYIHRPNLTELGKGNTHECYMLIPADYDLTELFPVAKEITFLNPKTNLKYKLKSANGREFRVNQMGNFYRDNDIQYGDSIICTMISSENESHSYISCIKSPQLVISGSNERGFELFNSQILPDFKEKSSAPYVMKVMMENIEYTMSISFLKSAKKRSDSPNETDYYSVVCPAIIKRGIYTLNMSDMVLGKFIKSEFNQTIW